MACSRFAGSSFGCVNYTILEGCWIRRSKERTLHLECLVVFLEVAQSEVARLNR
jgi:hypothetical protein